MGYYFTANKYKLANNYCKIGQNRKFKNINLNSEANSKFQNRNSV